MQLKRAEFHNFKLLENVALEFSTDPSRPLTVVRAENGSGKTSILWALLWGFYGSRGLPSGAQNLRLTSSAAPVDVPVEVQVVVDFARSDGTETTDYRMIRSVHETPKGGDKFTRGPVKVRLIRRVAAGVEDVDGDPESVLLKFLPTRLKSVFFTDGDDVQRFIAGESAHGRQSRVHDAIRALLGLDELRVARDDVEHVSAHLRRQAAKSAGAGLEEAEKRLSKIGQDIDKRQEELGSLTTRRGRISSARAESEKELSDIRGVGDIDELNDQLKRREQDLKQFEKREESIHERMKRSLSSQDVAWTLAKGKMLQGYRILDELADRGVIPGTSVEVLTDRIELGECICGADLSVGQSARRNVEMLREEQREISASRSRQTETFHAARMGRAAHEASCDADADFAHERKKLLAEYAQNRDCIRETGSEIEMLKEKRAAIDEDQVQLLANRIKHAERKLADTSEEIGRLEKALELLGEKHGVAKETYDTAEKASKVSGILRTQRLVADDLKELVSTTLAVLESESVNRVSARMNDMFMEIVGSNPDLAGAVFRSVRITDEFDIVVNTAGDGHLDPDFEVNGASQRALTLSFIWALMEVANQVAPRIIDTPLGMTAGGVKRRMVEAITDDRGGKGPNFQVVLLLTRSEIRDIEGLLEKRAGATQTLSCNKDYPVDLVHDWSIDRPLVRRCDCSHRELCEICQRRYDEDHGLVARGG